MQKSGEQLNQYLQNLSKGNQNIEEDFNGQIVDFTFSLNTILSEKQTDALADLVNSVLDPALPLLSHIFMDVFPNILLFAASKDQHALKLLENIATTCSPKEIILVVLEQLSFCFDDLPVFELCLKQLLAAIQRLQIKVAETLERIFEAILCNWEQYEIHANQEALSENNVEDKKGEINKTRGNKKVQCKLEILDDPLILSKNNQKEKQRFDVIIQFAQGIQTIFQSHSSNCEKEAKRETMIYFLSNVLTIGIGIQGNDESLACVMKWMFEYSNELGSVLVTSVLLPDRVSEQFSEKQFGAFALSSIIAGNDETLSSSKNFEGIPSMTYYPLCINPCFRFFIFQKRLAVNLKDHRKVVVERTILALLQLLENMKNTGLYYSCLDYEDFVQGILDCCVRQTNKTDREKSFQVFTTFLKSLCFPAFVSVLEMILQKSPYDTIISHCLYLVKEEIRLAKTISSIANDTNLGIQDTFECAGSRLQFNYRQLGNRVWKIVGDLAENHRYKSKLSCSSDVIISFLNLYRYVLLAEKNSTNQINFDIWNPGNIDRLKNSILLPLRGGLEILLNEQTTLLHNEEKQQESIRAINTFQMHQSDSPSAWDVKDAANKAISDLLLTRDLLLRLIEIIES